jgi:hypothetical protein
LNGDVHQLIPITSGADIGITGKSAVRRYLFVGGARGITQFTSSYALGLAQCSRNALLHQDGIFDPNTLCILNDLAMTNNGIHFRLCNLFRITSQGSQTLFLLQRVGTGGRPLKHLRNSRFRLRRESPEFLSILWAR